MLYRTNDKPDEQEKRKKQCRNTNAKQVSNVRVVKVFEYVREIAENV
jgi:hypothetical protein